MGEYIQRGGFEHTDVEARARAREQTEDPPMSDPFEQSDYPCYTASDFKTILKYLPNVPDLRANFHRSAFGTYELVKPIFFVVEGHDHIFESACVSTSLTVVPV